MGCVVLYVYREYEKNGQSFFVPFSIKVPRFMPTISRFLFFTRECELWCEIPQGDLTKSPAFVKPAF